MGAGGNELAEPGPQKRKDLTTNTRWNGTLAGAQDLLQGLELCMRSASSWNCPCTIVLLYLGNELLLLWSIYLFGL